ncbi:hypothetical protein QBC39DRAFT_358751 [Podospora conica]|nr:hypothetical protein QBC39DRAFT_358751 [Schizothecium conicum]
MEMRTGQVEASRVSVGGTGLAWCRWWASWRRAGDNDPSSRQGSRPSGFGKFWGCGSLLLAAFCILRAAAVCGVTDGRAGASLAQCGERFSGTTGAHTSHTIAVSSTGRSASLFTVPLPMAPGPEVVSVSLPPDGVAAVWAAPVLTLHHGCGDLYQSRIWGRRWRRCISPEFGRHCNDGISPGTDRERVCLLDGAEGEGRICPTSSFPSVPVY